MGSQWDRSADLVVVGFGGAGAAAALAGAELGATVLILEKQPAARHTPSTSMSGGIVMATSDVERATAYLDRCAGGMIPIEVSRAWAAKGIDLVGWLDHVGADLALEQIGGAEHPEFEGAEAIESWAQSRPSDRVPPGTTVREHKPGAKVNVGTGAAPSARRIGYEYFAGLRSAVNARSKIGVLYQTPARHLIQDGSGRVIGVEAVQAGRDGRDGRAIRIRAARGVVLTTGGYEFSDEMKINYLKASPMYFYGNPGNTGDGIRMAQEAGADLWHMNQMVGRAIGHFELDGQELNFVIGIHPPGYVITDRYGRRFANEYPQAEMKYYCMPLYPGGPNTCGGPRRDEHARILTPFGRPIPGLYGAGELGEAVGLLYPANGGNLSESVCFGRIAAEHAMGAALAAGVSS
jgi:succinate dehydrogenase/fumarate reductase flavoprotein subunit